MIRPAVVLRCKRDDAGGEGGYLCVRRYGGGRVEADVVFPGEPVSGRMAKGVGSNDRELEATPSNPRLWFVVPTD
jgi:hypothetical protein